MNGLKKMRTLEQRARRWLPALLRKVLRPDKEREFLEEIKSLPATCLSHTPFGVRSYVSAGTGPHTIVFESGLGHGKEVWAPVFNALRATSRVLAYDRAGYGQSEHSSLVRDGAQIVEELRALLHAENIPSPYVLVGHSLGGTIVKLFARTYPREVAGVVLVDARDADFVQRCRNMGLPRLLYEPPHSLFMWGSSAMRRELKASAATTQQARSTGVFPGVPLRVLTHHRRAFHWMRGVAQAWAVGQSSMAGMSAKGRIKVCDRSGHHIHRDRPDLVARAIRSVLAAARRARPVPRGTLHRSRGLAGPVRK
jgi:pimeloyl-ACP methyl ester carboxylesterase